MQQVSEILKLFTQLIQLLGLGGGTGGASNMLKQLVSLFGQGSSLVLKNTKPKRKKKKKNTSTQGGGLGGGGGGKGW